MSVIEPKTSSSYEVETDSTSEDEALPPEELEDLDDEDVPEELKTLEAELAELEREEQLIREEEEKLAKSAPIKRSESAPVSVTEQKKKVPSQAVETHSEDSFHNQTKSTKDTLSLLSSQLRTLINNPEHSDIVLVSEGKKVACHKVILSIRCPYFKKQFEINKAAREHNLQNVKYPVLMGLLEYIYTGNTSVHKDWAEQLYFVAQGYEMPELQNICESIIDDKGLSRSGSAASFSSFARTSSDFVIPAIETDKMREMRKNVATELYHTEKSYVKSLQLIFDEFVTPLNNAEKTGTPIVPKEMKVGMFSYWEVLLKCHVTLLKTIEDRVKVWDQRPEIGDIFIEKTAFIKLYKHYVNNFDKSVVEYKQLKETNGKFKEFLAKLEYTPKLQMQSLQSFLIMPIQRIPRYVLLLQDMLRSTTESHPDYENLRYGVKNMKELADYINANKNDADEINKILSVQDKLIGWPEKTSLVKPRRRIVKEGTFVKPGTSTKFQAVLFTDALLYCKIKGKDKLKYKGLILLSTSSLNIDPKPGEKWGFEIISQSGKIQFSVPPEEKDMWIQALRDTMERSKSELLNSAFSGFELKESEGSKQFIKLREEENIRRRSEVALQIKDSEEDYVRKMKIILDSFLGPLKAAANTRPIIPMSDINEIFQNVDAIHASHDQFLKQLQSRIHTWDTSTMLADLFMPQIINSAKIYQQYHENHGSSVERFDQCMENSLNFKTFVMQKETETKLSLPELLDLPLKRLPKYYLLLEELIQYTPEGHQDLVQLKAVSGRLKEHVEDQQKLVKSVGRKGSSKNMLARKGSGNFSPVSPQVRKSVQLSSVGRKSVDLVSIKALNSQNSGKNPLQ